MFIALYLYIKGEYLFFPINQRWDFCRKQQKKEFYSISPCGEVPFLREGSRLQYSGEQDAEYACGLDSHAEIGPLEDHRIPRGVRDSSRSGQNREHGDPADEEYLGILVRFVATPSETPTAVLWTVIMIPAQSSPPSSG